MIQTEENVLLEAVYYQSSECIILVKVDGTIRCANPRARAILGYEEDDLTGLKIDLIFPFLSGLSPVFQTDPFGGRSFWEAKCKDGSVISVKGKSGQPIAGDIFFVVKFSPHDEFSNLESYERLMDTMLEGIQIHDFNWRYTYVNESLVSYSQYSKEELIGFTLMEKYPGIDQTDLFKVMSRCMTERVAEKLETEFVFPDGTKMHFELSIRPVPEGIFILSINITERKKAEQERRRSENYFNSLVDEALDSIYVVDGSEKPRFLAMNPSGCKMLGYSKEEILQLTTYDIIFENEFDDSKLKIEKLRLGQSLRSERMFKRKDGTALFVEMTAKQMEDGNIIVVARDVSERKAAESQLVRSEMRFRALVENSRDVISLLDANFKTIYRSPSASRMLGWTDEELNHAGTAAHIHADDRDRIQKNISQLLNNAGMAIGVEFREKHKNGHYLWLEGVAVNLLQDDSVNAIVFNFRDVTEQKNAEQKLRVSELYYRSIFEQATDAIYITDANLAGKFLDINPSGSKMLGYTREEFLALNPADLLFEEDVITNPVNFGELKTGVVIVNERRLRRKDGTAVETESSGRILEDGNFIVFARDITERKRIEKEMHALNENLEARVKERTLELESFSYSVSHDLRAPLRAVNGYAKMLMEDYVGKLDDEGIRIITTIRRNAAKMGMLIDDLLAFSRLGRTEIRKEVVDLSELIEGVLGEVAKLIPHSAEIKVGNLHKVKADYSLLSQAVFNLISNAIKYSSKSKNPRVEIFSTEEHGKITFSVKDNGVGFEMQYYDKLFGVFQRLHSQDEFEGTGVGLAIVQRIIAKHEGRVWAVSTLGEGATFSFIL